MKTKNKNLRSIREYAELCNVSKTVIFKRIENNDLQKVDHDGSFFIDIKKFPPKGPGKPGRRFVSMIL